MGKRIVINVDAPPAGRGVPRPKPVGGKRRWPKVLAILFGLFLLFVVAVAVGGFLWWRHYQSTPTYSLTLMIDAAQRNDVAEFKKRVDDEEIAKNMVASISQKAAARYGFALDTSVQQQIDKVIQSLMPRLKQSINDEMVKQIKEFASKSEPRPFIFLIVTVPSLMKVTTEGDTAKATAALADRTIELTMRRDAERWKVTEFKDDAVVQRVVDSIMTELPAIGSIDSRIPLFKKPARGRRGRNR